MEQNHVNRALWASKEYDSLNNVLNLPHSVKNEVMRLYWLLINKSRSQGVFTDRAVGVLAYYVCKRDGQTISMSEVASALGTDKFTMFKTYKTVARGLGLSSVTPRASELITRYSNNLGLSTKTI